MEISRTIEEITLIEQEMINYIVYYKNTALTKLNDQHSSLEKCLAELDLYQDTGLEYNATLDSLDDILSYTTNLNNKKFLKVKECDEAHLEDHLIQLAEELGEEISEDVADESEDDGCYDDIDDNDYCNDDQT
ncbi:Hypothetical predicted protein [Paramuricea clavata]|uniref:Uncharacterized protein n=1 Tax=Paramuricea clavata TaxID=317549 RepID=A0A6S7GJM4_PARCT|nr:Hypothetical predicted protein [Paramuricea clavata]